MYLSTAAGSCTFTLQPVHGEGWGGKTAMTGGGEEKKRRGESGGRRPNLSQSCS